MACVFESHDNSMIVKPTGDASRWNSTDLIKEVDRIQKMYPQLANQDLAASKKLLEEQKLLPGFELVASRGEDGRVRDGDGRVVILNSTEMKELLAADDKANREAYSKRWADARTAFDRFAVGNPNAAPDDLINLARISQDQIKEALKTPDLTADERAGLELLDNNFEELHEVDPFYSNESISKRSFGLMPSPSFNQASENLNKYSTLIDENVTLDPNFGYRQNRSRKLEIGRSDNKQSGYEPELDWRKPAKIVRPAEVVDTREIYSVLEWEQRGGCAVPASY